MARLQSGPSHQACAERSYLCTQLTRWPKSHLRMKSDKHGRVNLWRVFTEGNVKGSSDNKSRDKILFHSMQGLRDCKRPAEAHSNHLIHHGNPSSTQGALGMENLSCHFFFLFVSFWITPKPHTPFHITTTAIHYPIHYRVQLSLFSTHPYTYQVLALKEHTFSHF